MTSEKKTTIEYIEPQKKQSNTLAAIGTALGGVALAGVAGNAMSSVVNRYAGQISQSISGGTPLINPVAAVAPLAVGAATASTVNAISGGGYVTKEESGLIREISSKDSLIAQLTAEKYTDTAVKEATRELRLEMKSEIEPLKNRVCDLETLTAVNSTSDRAYRRYAERVFVHQPRAYMNEQIVTCESNKCGCKCGHTHDNCNEGW